jgi:hypothetical protein
MRTIIWTIALTLQSSLPAAYAADLTLNPITKTYVLPTLQLDGAELPMMGKDVSTEILLNKGPKPEPVWITGFRSRVFDEEKKEFSSDFVCHSHIVDQFNGGYRAHRFLGNGGGASDFHLPKGFGVRMVSSKEHPLLLYGMAADYSHRTKMRKVHYEIDVDYYDDATATKLGLKDLDFSYVTLIRLTPGAHHHMPTKINGDYPGIHWPVPPGEHLYSNALNPQIPPLAKTDLRVYHVNNHLHPYADWSEIYDLTDQRSIWRGLATTYPDRSVVKEMSHYSSGEGFVLKKDHKYEMRAHYTNPKNKDIDGMLALRLLYLPEDPNTPRVLSVSNNSHDLRKTNLAAAPKN